MSDSPANTELNVRWPLRVVLPLLLIASVAFASWWSVYYSRSQVSRRVNQDAVRNLRWATTQLTAALESASRDYDTALMKQEVAVFGGMPDIVSAILTDENYRVIASLRRDHVNRPLSDVLSPRYQQMPLLDHARLEESKSSLIARFKPLRDDGVLVGARPVVLGVLSNELRPTRVGMLVVIYDVVPTIDRELTILHDQTLDIFLVSSLFAVGLGVFFHFRVAKRLQRLTSAAGQVREGKLNVQSGVTGSDEVAVLATSFDDMVLERRRNEEQLQTSESRFRALFQQAAVGVAEIDSHTGRFLEINQRYCDIVGYSREQMRHLDFTSITYPSDVQPDLDNMSRLMAGTIREFSMEKRYIRADSSVVWINLTVSPRWQPGEEPSTHIAIVQDITQQVISRRKLAEREQRYRQLVENSPVCIHEVDLDGRLLSMNSVGLKMLGLTEESEVRGLEYLSTVCERDRPRVGELFERAYQGETIQFGFETATGALFESSFVPLLDDDGNVERIMGLTRDVTEQVQVEENLRESEALFRTIFEQAAVGVAQLDAVSGTILQANTRYCEILGVSAESLLGKSWLHLAHPDDLAANRTNRERMLAGEIREFTTEKRVQHSDGAFVWINLTVSSMGQPGQAPSTHIAIVEDIADRKSAETALLESRERLSKQFAEVELVYRTAPVGLCLMDADLRFVRINEELAAINGPTVEEHIGKHLREVLPDIADSIEPIYQRVIASGEPAINLDVERLHPEQPEKKLSYLAGYHPLKDSEGMVIGVSSVVQDITELKDAERELMRREMQLRSMVNALTVAEERERRRISRVLHDQLSPTLAVCQMRVSVLENSSPEPDNKQILHEIWERLDECSQQARSLAVETSPPVLYELGLASAVEWLAERFQQQHGIPCSVSARTSSISLDQTTLAPMFQSTRELLINVARHAQATRIDISIDTEDGFVVVCVNDDGIGFDPQDRSPSTLKSQGFGLFGIRDRFDILGGRVEVDSTPGSGTRVSLYAPVSIRAGLL